MTRRHATGHGLRFLQFALSLSIGAGCLWLMAGQLAAGFWQEVVSELSGLSPVAVLLAGICAGVSFLAVGRYDAVAHRHFGTNVEANQAWVSGTIAIALAQTLGIGMITGALARWRMLPDIALKTALRLSAFVCLTFMAALLVISAFACLLLPAPAFSFWPALAVVISLPFVTALVFFYPAPKVAGARLRLPSVVALGSILVWTVLDVVAASTALYLLIPATAVPYAVLLPLFLCALMAALLSGTPGGVGPFELILLAYLPDAASVQVMSGIIAFRAIYYAIPAMLAMALTLRPLASQTATTQPPEANLQNAPRAEVGVIRQNGGYVQGGTAMWPAGQSLCALFDPIGKAGPALIALLVKSARDKNLVPCLYKCSARTALEARKYGWYISHIADEAVISPQEFAIAAAPFRRLRRKLRASEKAGVVATQASVHPLQKMARIDEIWQQNRGTARGGTIGTFCPEYLSHQRVFLAHQNGRLIAFASFHQTQREWCLDLMRQTPDAPDGTMHLLVHRAILNAANVDVSRLSLAAVPACPDPSSATLIKLAQIVVEKSGGPGLRQFKSSFRPRWQPLYAAAPNRAYLALALADIARAVHQPSTSVKSTKPHDGNENYEVASRLAS